MLRTSFANPQRVMSGRLAFSRLSIRTVSLIELPGGTRREGGLRSIGPSSTRLPQHRNFGAGGQGLVYGGGPRRPFRAGRRPPTHRDEPTPAAGPEDGCFGRSRAQPPVRARTSPPAGACVSFPIPRFPEPSRRPVAEVERIVNEQIRPTSVTMEMCPARTPRRRARPPFREEIREYR
jgi:hypothetical protein